MKDTSGISFVPPSAKRGSEMMASKRLNSQFNRNINTESEFGELLPLKVEPDDKNLGTLPLGSLKDTFEALNFVDQAKVMRLSLNEQRCDRFLGLYESNQPALHKRIRNFGQNHVSKSIDASGYRRQRYNLTKLKNEGPSKSGVNETKL